jgi:hypothetical protein
VGINGVLIVEFSRSNPNPWLRNAINVAGQYSLQRELKVDQTVQLSGMETPTHEVYTFSFSVLFTLQRQGRASNEPILVSLTSFLQQWDRN